MIVTRPLVRVFGSPAKAAKTHCPRGHAFTPENTYHRKGSDGRICRQCMLDSKKAQYVARKARRVARDEVAF